jgi:hypothetical protein
MNGMILIVYLLTATALGVPNKEVGLLIDKNPVATLKECEAGIKAGSAAALQYAVDASDGSKITNLKISGQCVAVSKINEFLAEFKARHPGATNGSGEDQ